MVSSHTTIWAVWKTQTLRCAPWLSALLGRGFPTRNVGSSNGQIRRKLRDLPGVDYTKSFTDGSKSVIYINLKENLPSDKIRPAWEEARNMINDEWKSLPQGVQGPTINDRFDDVYGIIYAISGDEFSYEEKRQQAEDLKRQLLSVPNVKKSALLGFNNKPLM